MASTASKQASASPAVVAWLSSKLFRRKLHLFNHFWSCRVSVAAESVVASARRLRMILLSVCKIFFCAAHVITVKLGAVSKGESALLQICLFCNYHPCKFGSVDSTNTLQDVILCRTNPRCNLPLNSGRVSHIS